MASAKKFKILSIDGGGIRGVIPLQIIKHIEGITNQEIHKSFDLIAGTSTGGILSCALTFEDSEDLIANKRKFSIEQLEDIYKLRGKEIFPFQSNPISKGIVDIQKWWQPKFNPKYLNTVLTDYFGDKRITSCLKPIFIASYDIHRNKPTLFTYRNASLSLDMNPTLVEICRATSAAPTYFPSYDFSYASERLSCIDGGIFMNNPALGALVEVLGNSDYKLYRINNEALQLKDIAILSIGTGYSSTLIDSNKANKWGQLKWIKPVIELSTNGPVKVIHDQLDTIFKSFELDSNYLRIDMHINNEHFEMSDSRDQNIDYLIQKANSEITNNETLKLKLDLFLKESGIIE